LSIRYGQKKPLGSGNKREKSNGQNSKTQDGKVAAETRDAETRDAQTPSARRNAARRVGQAPRRTQGAAQDVVAGTLHCACLRPEAHNGCLRPQCLCHREARRKKSSRAHVSIKPFANLLVNAAKMCACSNTLTSKPKNIARFLNVTVNKSTDIVQGFLVRTDSNSREK